MIKYLRHGEEQWESVDDVESGKTRIDELKKDGAADIQSFELEEQDWSAPWLPLTVEVTVGIYDYKEPEKYVNILEEVFGETDIKWVQEGDHTRRFKTTSKLKIGCPLIPGLRVDYFGLELWVNGSAYHNSKDVSYDLSWGKYITANTSFQSNLKRVRRDLELLGVLRAK